MKKLISFTMLLIGTVAFGQIVGSFPKAKYAPSGNGSVNSNRVYSRNGSTNSSYGTFRVTAYTKNQYGDNYAVDLYIKGRYGTYPGNQIDGVYIKTAEGSRAVNYYGNQYNDGAGDYYVYFGENKYYFDF